MKRFGPHRTKKRQDEKQISCTNICQKGMASIQQLSQSSTTTRMTRKKLLFLLLFASKSCQKSHMTFTCYAPYIFQLFIWIHSIWFICVHITLWNLNNFFPFDSSILACDSFTWFVWFFHSMILFVFTYDSFESLTIQFISLHMWFLNTTHSSSHDSFIVSFIFQILPFEFYPSQFF